MPEGRCCITSATKQALYIIAGIVAAVAVLYGLYAIATGSLVVPDEVQSKFWGGIVIALVVGSTWLQQMNANRLQQRNEERADILRANSDANASATQGKVDDLTKAVADGFPKVVAETTAALVDDAAKKTAATLATTLASTEAQKKADELAQKQRDDLAAVHAKVDMLLERLNAPPPVAPVADQPVAAAIEQAAETLRSEIADNSTKTAANTEATDANSSARLTALEDAATPPKDKP